MDEGRGGTGAAECDGGFFRAGRFVVVAAPFALVALTAAWLFLGATGVRDVVV